MAMYFFDVYINVGINVYLSVGVLCVGVYIHLFMLVYACMFLDLCIYLYMGVGVYVPLHMSVNGYV